MNELPPPPVPPTSASSIPEIEHTLTRVRAAPDLPTLLAEAFDAFELIRLLARAYEEQAPALLAVFMTAADAAVDGREALTVAPSLPPGRSRLTMATVSADAVSLDAVADALASLASVLAERLTAADAEATVARDQSACQEAAHAAQRISQFMARGDDSHLR